MKSLTVTDWNDAFNDNDIVVMNGIITRKRIAEDLAKMIRGREPILFPASKEQITHYLNIQEAHDSH
jgi:hypothetical protein